MMMSLRAVLWRSNPLLNGKCLSRKFSHLDGDCFVGKSTLLATTCNEMKSLDEESAKILKTIKEFL
jgi:hypothetical protein